MFRSSSALALLLGALVLPGFSVRADNADTANKSNNPLNLAPGANLQDYYTPRLYDSNAHSNDLSLRGTLPVAPSDFIGVPSFITCPRAGTCAQPAPGPST